MNRKIYILLFSFVFGSTIHAQDIHFSHVNRQPIYQNPANTGLFDGDIRFTGNYKDQWRSVTVPFQTTAFGGEYKLKKQKIDLGGLFFHDAVGDGKFKTIELLFSVAKNLKLVSDSSLNLKYGLSFGLNYRQFDFSKFYFDNQFNGVSYDPNLAINESLSGSTRANLNSSLGAVLSWRRGMNQLFNFGFSLHNLNRPNQGFYNVKVTRDIRTSIFGTGKIELNQAMNLLPGFGVNLQGKYRELLLGSQYQYVLENRLGKYKAIDGGLWFRNKDAIIVRFGCEIQNWGAAISYDTNISKLTPASNLRGGLELSAFYILKKFKPEKIRYRVCPDYL